MIVFRWGATHTNNGVRAPCIYACLQGFSMQTRTSWGLASLCKHLNATCAIVGCPTSCLYPCRVTEQRLYRKLCIMCVCVCVRIYYIMFCMLDLGFGCRIDVLDFGLRVGMSDSGTEDCGTRGWDRSSVCVLFVGGLRHRGCDHTENPHSCMP